MNKNLKLFLKAALLVLGLFVLGYIFGSVLGKNTNDIDFQSILNVDHEAVGVILMVLQLFTTFIPLITVTVQYLTIKKSASRWDGEDEEYIDNIENAINAPMVRISTALILNIILFSCSSYFLLENIKPYSAIPSITFLIGMVWHLILSEKMVSLEKLLNPEKKGSIFDPKFQKKWLASCDEGQKQIIWRSGYKAYLTGNTACYILWIITFVFQTILKFGIMPMICIGVIWLTMHTAYMRTATKLEARNYKDDTDP